MTIQMGIETIGKRQVRYYRESDWPSGTCWVFLVTGQDERKHIYIGMIERTEHPRRYNGKTLKADAALEFLARHARESR